jgi:hypothetical protein
MGQIRNLGIEPVAFSVIYVGINLNQGEQHSTPILSESDLSILQGLPRVVLEGEFDIVKPGYFGYTVLRHLSCGSLPEPEKAKTEKEEKFESAKADFFKALKPKAEVAEAPVVEEPSPVAEEPVAASEEPVPLTEEEIYEKFGNSESEADFVQAMVDTFKKAALVEMCEAREIVALGNKEALARALFENYLISK